MSRYHKDRDDTGVAKRGAGPYSRSYLKTTTKSPSMRGYQTSNESVSFKGYTTPEGAGSVQDLIAGKSVWNRVDAASKVNYGLSGALPRGHRPAHKAGKLTGSGIDAPDSTSFKKHKDYR